MRKKYGIAEGDCVVVMNGMPAESVDAIVTDPPYEIDFMGKGWDGAGVAFDVKTWAAALRVLKPGGHLLAFGGTRTYHRMTVAIEDAGFEIRDSIIWLYGTGFPKSHNLHGDWEGWGTALKPAHEPIVVARKPFKGTVAANVLEYGTGGLNIDGTRIGTGAEHDGSRDGEASANKRYDDVGSTDFAATPGPRGGSSSGRWPANVILSHHEDCMQVGTRKVWSGNSNQGVVHGSGDGATFLSTKESGGHYGTEEIPTYQCVPGCPVTELDEQSGQLTSGSVSPDGFKGDYTADIYGTFAHNVINPATVYADTGGASRFFYVAKPSKKERNLGLDDAESKVGDTPRKNTHPTVKPVTLMRYLIRLVTPPNGIVLDPFVGSGTTLMAGVMEGVRVFGIEENHEYAEIARKRAAASVADATLNDDSPPDEESAA